MQNDVTVNEKLREIHFASGEVLTLHNVTFFNATGSMLRLGADEGYILVNPSQVNFMQIDGERVA